LPHHLEHPHRAHIDRRCRCLRTCRLTARLLRLSCLTTRLVRLSCRAARLVVRSRLFRLRSWRAALLHRGTRRLAIGRRLLPQEGNARQGEQGRHQRCTCSHGRILRWLFHAPHRQACFVAHARVSKDGATSVPNRLLPHGQTQRPDPKPICRLPLKDRLNSHSPWPRNLSAHRVILAVSKTPIPRARSTARAAAVRSRNVSQFLHSVPGGGYGIVAFILQRKACSNRTTCKTNAAHFSAPLVETGQNCRWSHSQVNRKPRVCAWPSPTQQPTPIMS
jgi:hypothetical protein